MEKNIVFFLYKLGIIFLIIKYKQHDKTCMGSDLPL